MITKPMLAATVKDVATLRYPLICTPKVDGIRCLIVNHQAVSRSLKPIPNQSIRTYLEHHLPEGADGEIVSGNFQNTTSSVMTQKGNPFFAYLLFDYVDDPTVPYSRRLINLMDLNIKSPHITVLPIHLIMTSEELLEFEQQCLDLGYEGICMRDPDSPYKFGRSTLKEQYLLKLKRFKDSEAIVIGFEEQMENTNIAKINKLGLTERSSSKHGKIKKGTLGKLLVRDIYSNIEFKLGTGQGLTEQMRKEIWNNRKDYLNKVCKYRYQEVGVKNAPRIPVWTGWRSKGDL